MHVAVIRFFAKTFHKALSFCSKQQGSSKYSL